VTGRRLVVAAVGMVVVAGAIIALVELLSGASPSYQVQAVETPAAGTPDVALTCTPGPCSAAVVASAKQEARREIDFVVTSTSAGSPTPTCTVQVSLAGKELSARDVGLIPIVGSSWQATADFTRSMAGVPNAAVRARCH